MDNYTKNDYSFNNDIDLKDLRLLEANPRYIDEEYDLNTLGTNNYFYDEIKIIQKLISYEEHLNDLKALIVSLSLGFKPFEDPIFVKQGKDKEYYVVEGNRRVMCLKFLTLYKNEFTKDINDNKLFKELIKNNRENKAYLDEDIRENMENLVLSNYSIIFETINNFKQNYIDNFSYVFIGNHVTNDEIWILINGRQSAEKTGKRIFGRLHQFYLFLSKFNVFLSDLGREESNINLVLEKLSKHFGRTINKSMIHSAVWCKSLVEIYNKKNPNKKINKLMFAPSAIELSRSMVSFENERNINNSITKNISLKYKLAEYKDLDKLSYNISSEKFEKLALWLVEKFISGKLTTRGLESISDNEELRNIIIFDNNIKSLNQQIKEIELKVEKKIEITPLEKQIKEYGSTGDNIIKKANENIKNNNNLKFKNKIKKTINYIWTFDVPGYFQKNLYKENSLPFVSLSASIRSTYDLLIFLALDISDELLNLIREFYNNINFGSKEARLISGAKDQNDFNVKKAKWIKMFTREGMNKLIQKYNTIAVDRIRNMLKDEENFINEELVDAIIKCHRMQKWLKQNEIKYNIIDNIEMIFSFWKSSKQEEKHFSDRDVLNKIIHSSYIISDENFKVKIINSLNKQYKFLFQMLESLKII